MVSCLIHFPTSFLSGSSVKPFPCYLLSKSSFSWSSGARRSPFQSFSAALQQPVTLSLNGVFTSVSHCLAGGHCAASGLFPFLMSYIILYRTTADLHALPSCKISFQVHTIILQQLTVSASSAILSHGHCIAHSFIKCHSQSTDKSIKHWEPLEILILLWKCDVTFRVRQKQKFKRHVFLWWCTQ